jgi:hypothetical protein
MTITGSNEPTDEVYEQAENSILKMKIVKIKLVWRFSSCWLVADYYLKENLTKKILGSLIGKMENNIGYIQIKSMFLYGFKVLKFSQKEWLCFHLYGCI